MTSLPDNKKQIKESDAQKKNTSKQAPTNATTNTSSTAESADEPKSKRKTGRRKSQLEKDEIRQLKEAFAFFDHNNDGEISTQEIGKVMKALGLDITEEELKDIMNDLDENGDGHMDFDEFVLMMDRRMSVNSQVDEIKATFNFFDKKGDGKIDFDELKEGLCGLGEDVTDKDVQDMIKEADMNGDGYIDFQEFMQMMMANEDEHTKKSLLLRA